MKTKHLLLATLACGVIAVGVWLWLENTNRFSPAITVRDLKIDAAAFPGLDHIEAPAEVIDSDPGNPNAPGMILMLRDLGIRSSANYRIWLRAEPLPLIVKARINVFVDAQHAAEDLAKRYSPQARAMSSRLTLGDDSFNLQDRLVAMRIDRVQVELALTGSPDRLMALAAAYERFVLAKLGKH